MVMPGGVDESYEFLIGKSESEFVFIGFLNHIFILCVFFKSLFQIPIDIVCFV